MHFLCFNYIPKILIYRIFIIIIFLRNCSIYISLLTKELCNNTLFPDEKELMPFDFSILLHCDKTTLLVYIIFIWKNSLTFSQWPHIWSIFMNVSHVFEKKKYSFIRVKGSICIHNIYLGIMLFRLYIHVCAYVCSYIISFLFQFALCWTESGSIACDN